VQPIIKVTFELFFTSSTPAYC